MRLIGLPSVPHTLGRFVLPGLCLLCALLAFVLREARLLAALLACLSYVLLCLAVWLPRRQVAGDESGDLLLAYASQSGQAREIATRSAAQLRQAGQACRLLPLERLQPSQLEQYRRALFVVSTYGEGEAPDNGALFERRLHTATADLRSLEFAVLALGDSHYRHFCAFGERLERRLRRLHATPLCDLLRVDRGDPATLRHWQQQLAQLAGSSDFDDWQPPQYEHWRLRERRLLNPGSLGGPVYHLRLDCAEGARSWRAGDLVEIGPRHSRAACAALLEHLGLASDSRLNDGSLLLEALRTRRWPESPEAMRGLEADALLAALPALPHREYSIASQPGDGALELLVRLARRADGSPGLGSGWLCLEAGLDERIDLRIRSNPAFHGPDPGTPLILIGNGTGLAGLRAHLRERPPGTRNWLLFGERQVSRDAFFADELQAWQASGHLQRLDLAWSRDQAQPVYVQHLLRDQADSLRRWLDDGAALYLCGSLQGMGLELHQLLCGLLGETQLQALAEQGRYRRDLY